MGTSIEWSVEVEVFISLNRIAFLLLQRVEMEASAMGMPPHMHMQRGPAPPGAQWASPQRHPMNPMMGGMPQSPQQVVRVIIYCADA